MINPSHHAPLYLAIDQGGHASRALVFNERGDVVAQAFCEITTHTPQTDWVEHDAEMMVASVLQVINAVMEKLGNQVQAVQCAGLATQRSSIVCWSRSTGRALSQVISWQDRRAAAWMEPFKKEAEYIHTITGLFPSPHYGASKLRWCLEQLPAVASTLAEDDLAIGPLASFLIARITRERHNLVDPANASRTLLWNITTRHWDDTLLHRFTIPEKALPQCVPSAYSFGHLLGRWPLPLTVVTGDQSAALFHNGAPDPNTTYINLGTGAFIQRIQIAPFHQTPHLLSSIVYTDQEQTYAALEGTVNGAGSALAWFAQEESQPNWVNHAAAWLTTTTPPPLFINTIGGLGSPFWETRLSPAYIGEGNCAARFCAVLESILFLIQTNLDEMNYSVEAPTQIVLSGGIATLDTLCQKLANLSGYRLLRPAQSEASARGLAFLLAKTPHNWQPIDHPDLFLPQNDTPLQQRYQAWLTALEERLTQL
ncbi:MAG: glycerol kinase [Halothiobacillaceae bacterium]|nr:MAG: glycerol kinase [Halothiobacillaceae bacterium]